MKIEKANVVHCDEYGARVTEIKTDKGTFQTPDRVVTSTESNYKKRVRILDDPYENPVFEVIGHFTLENLEALHMKNGPFAHRKTDFSAHVRGYEEMITKFYPQMKKDTKLSPTDIRTLADLQRYCGFDLITIPDLAINSKVEEFEKHITSLAENFILVYSNAEPIPYVDMAMDEELFKKKVNAIWDNRGIFKVMGVIFRSPPQHYANYSYLYEKNDRDIWIHASGVNRYYPRNWTTAQMHIPQIYGIDTCSILSQKLGIEPPPKPLEKIKRYDPKTLGIIEIEKHRGRYGTELDCDCPVCSGKTLDEFINEYRVNHRGEEDISLLDTWCKIHEAFTSPKEFEIGRIAIKENRFKEYIAEKEDINNVIDDFKKT
jgi:hypothetical protein